MNEIALVILLLLIGIVGFWFTISSCETDNNNKGRNHFEKNESREEAGGGFWFGIFDKNKPWRKTPTKISGQWYTPKGDKVRNPKAYFKTIEKRGRYWKGNTGWKNKKK